MTKTGTTLTHYRITAKLGEGGMGEVYRAADTTERRSDVELTFSDPWKIIVDQNESFR